MKKMFMKLVTGTIAAAMITLSVPAFAAGPSMLEVETNDSYETATPITLNQTYEGTLTSRNDVDCFKFNITERGRFSVSVGPAAGTSAAEINGGWTFGIYDKNRRQIRYRKLIKTIDPIDNLIYEKGTYYIQVWQPNKSYKLPTGQYSVRVDFTPMSDDEWSRWAVDDCGNSNVRTIENNKTYCGTVSRDIGIKSGDNDVDYDKFIMQTNTQGYLRLHFDALIEQGSKTEREGWTIIVKNDAGKKIFTYTTRSRKKEALEKIAYNGPFQVVVKGYWSNPSQYPLDLIYNLRVETYPKESSISNPTDPALLNKKDGVAKYACEEYGHSWAKKNTVIKATATEDGNTSRNCTDCGLKEIIAEYPAPKEIILSENVFVYDGKTKKPDVTVQDKNGREIDKKNYSVSYSDNKNAGEALAKIKFKGNFYSGILEAPFTITKAENPMTVSTKPVIVEYNRIKNRKLEINLSRAFTIKNIKGSLSFKKVQGNEGILISKTGKITIHAGLNRGKYKVNVQVSASGDKNYKARSEAVNLIITVA